MITSSGLAQALLFGVANGCVYILLATGLNLIFGVMKLVNFAHGQLLMVGAFVAYEVTTIAGLNPYVSIVVSMGSVALIGILLEKFAFRKVRGTEKLNEIFISLGLIYVFQNVATLLWVKEYNIRIPSPLSGLSLKRQFRAQDARDKHSLSIKDGSGDLPGCRCGEVLRGLISPPQCPLFGKKCGPDSPFGPCMVSFEGACFIYHKYARRKENG